MPTAIRPSRERQFHLGVDRLAVEVGGHLRPPLPLEVDHTPPMDEVRTNQDGVGIPLEPGEEDPSVLLDARESLVLVEVGVREDEQPLDPRADLQRVDLRGGLREQFEARGTVRPGADQGRHLDAGGAVRPGVLGQTGRRVELGEGREESGDRGVLDEEGGEPRQLRREAVPGRGAELGEGVGDAPSEELDEFGREPLVERAHAEDGVEDPLVVGVAERLDGALELGAGLEGEGVEEGDGGGSLSAPEVVSVRGLDYREPDANRLVAFDAPNRKSPPP